MGRYVEGKCRTLNPCHRCKARRGAKPNGNDLEQDLRANILEQIFNVSTDESIAHHLQYGGEPAMSSGAEVHSQKQRAYDSGCMHHRTRILLEKLFKSADLVPVVRINQVGHCDDLR